MARVKMLKTAAGPNGVREANREFDVPDDEALDLVEAKAAVLLSETAMRKGAPENAMRPRARGR